MKQGPESELDELVGRLAEGDRSAFTPAFRLLWPPALRLCRSMLKNDADAADAAQQGMEKVLRRASEYDRNRAALPWALAIMAWECRTIVRQRSRRREVAEEHAPDPSVSALDTTFEQREVLGAALQVLGQLSETDRDTLLATFNDEAEAGATFRKRRERAVKRLRVAFRNLYGLG